VRTKKLPGFPGSLKRRGILMESEPNAKLSLSISRRGNSPVFRPGSSERRGDPLGKHL
jgi:hypothetical protein